MDRLSTTALPLLYFKRCQLCGEVSDDICHFNFWIECDDNDKLEEENVLLICRKSSCQKIIDDHPRLYAKVPWGRGNPGHFILLCGNCIWRVDNDCSHKDYTKNGGEGLNLYEAGGFPNAIICSLDGCHRLTSPFTKCDGKEP